MKTIYVFSSNYPDCNGILDIFNTLEKAKKAKEKFLNHPYYKNMAYKEEYFKIKRWKVK